MEEFYEVLKEYNHHRNGTWFFKSEEEAKKKFDEEVNILKQLYKYGSEQDCLLPPKWTTTSNYVEVSSLFTGFNGDFYSESVSLLKHYFAD